MYQESIFDTNQITPGTDFMLELGEALTYAAKNSQYKVGKNVRVVVSDAFVAGEGEHKVLEDIRKNNITDTESICIYGLDADLIMLSLTLPTDNIILLREKTYVDGRGPSKTDLPFMFVSIEEIKSNIFIELMAKIGQKMPGHVQQQLISKQRLINDYIFLSFN
jgi:5'-3' exonuclease